MTPYVRAAIDGEIQSLRGTKSGRGPAAFRAAAAVGNFVGAGAINEADAENLLLEAALGTGLAPREALGHIRRGLRRGMSTPRSLHDDGWTPRSPYQPVRPHSQEPPKRPPKSEVDALWAATRPITTDDPEVTDWFRNRYRDHADSIVALAEHWDLARAVPRDLHLPRWAWSPAGDWGRSGHRIAFRLWDHTGQCISLRARCVDPTAELKSLAPAGFSIKGSVLADPLGVQLLCGAVPDWWETRKIVISEGEPDWLIWAARQSDADEAGPAYFGVEAGSWSQRIADRIPDGCQVVIRTDHDEPGNRYAEQIVDSLPGRCSPKRAGEVA